MSSKVFQRVKDLQRFPINPSVVSNIREKAEILLNNPILMTDSYETTHANQYPHGTQYVTSYIEARGGEYDYTIMYGLQIFLIKILSQKLTMEMVDQAYDFLVSRGHVGYFNYDGFRDIVTKLDGRWPVKIRAIPEGFKVDKKVVLLSITNTDPRFAWVTSYLETALLRAVW